MNSGPYYDINSSVSPKLQGYLERWAGLSYIFGPQNSHDGDDDKSGGEDMGSMTPRKTTKRHPVSVTQGWRLLH